MAKGDGKVTKEQIEKERSFLKRIIPGWEWAVERKFRKKKFRKEPFDTDEALLKEHRNMVKAEMDIKKMLEPVRKSSKKKIKKK